MANKSIGPVSERVGNIPEEARKKALETALHQLEKKFGKGAVMKLGQENVLNVEAISTGSLSLDLALGIGGLPKGRIIEIYGPESSGKTTVALHVVAEAQRQGGDALFVDVEHALDPVYARALGVDVDSLLVSQPDTGEQALEIAEALVRSGAISVVVIDSVAAMVTKAEIEGEMGESHVGLQARLMSQALRKLTGAIGKSNTIIIFINQLREKIGVMYGNPETTTGGRALKFYASVRLDIRKTETLKTSSNEMIGNRVKVKVAKNKVAPPFKEAEFDIMYGQGISKIGEILDLAVMLDIIKKSGSWFNYGETRLGQGRDNAKNFLQENPEIANEVEAKIRENADKLRKVMTPKGKKPVKIGASSPAAAQEDPAEKEADQEDASSSPDPAAEMVEEIPEPESPELPKVNIDVETDDE